MPEKNLLEELRRYWSYFYMKLNSRQHHDHEYFPSLVCLSCHHGPMHLVDRFYFPKPIQEFPERLIIINLLL